MGLKESILLFKYAQIKVLAENGLRNITVDYRDKKVLLQLFIETYGETTKKYCISGIHDYPCKIVHKPFGL